MLFDKLWAQVKGAERSGELTVEEALDCATRLPQALFCSMMDCLAENGEDPEVVLAQVVRLHEHILTRLRQVAASLRIRGGRLHWKMRREGLWTVLGVSKVSSKPARGVLPRSGHCVGTLRPLPKNLGGTRWLEGVPARIWRRAIVCVAALVRTRARRARPGAWGGSRCEPDGHRRSVRCRRL